MPGVIVKRHLGRHRYAFLLDSHHELDPDMNCMGWMVNDAVGPPAQLSKKEKQSREAAINTKFLVLYDAHGYPYLFLVALRVIPKDQEVLTDYGPSYW